MFILKGDSWDLLNTYHVPGSVWGTLDIEFLIFIVVICKIKLERERCSNHVLDQNTGYYYSSQIKQKLSGSTGLKPKVAQ